MRAQTARPQARRATILLLAHPPLSRLLRSSQSVDREEARCRGVQAPTENTSLQEQLAAARRRAVAADKRTDDMSRRLDCVPLSQLRVSADLPHTQLALPLSFCLYLPNIRTLLPFLCANNRENQHSILQSIIYCIIYYFLLKIRPDLRGSVGQRQRGAAGAAQPGPSGSAPLHPPRTGEFCGSRVPMRSARTTALGDERHSPWRAGSPSAVRRFPS